SHGAKPKFENAEDLWSACCEYFDWVDNNPLYEDKVTSFQGVNTHEPIAKMRAMTLMGLCFFIDVSIKQWNVWRDGRPDLSEVISRAEAVIYQQKFAGAAADLLNANIIARELGLADKQDLSSSDGSMTPPTLIQLVPLKGNDSG
ncbi:DNA-packaging protein, partial [Paenochrobactrum glaciei]|uniref:DNA-packaging protein n=2 Tax=Paenochrobactrum glaciei TaxID=486407 RepID=UPI0031D9A258